MRLCGLGLQLCGLGPIYRLCTDKLKSEQVDLSYQNPPHCTMLPVLEAGSVAPRVQFENFRRRAGYSNKIFLVFGGHLVADKNSRKTELPEN
jgi:hypothetical protein